MEFFDVALAPPRRGRPANLINYQGLLEAIEEAYLRRNVADFEWADDETGAETDEPPPEEG